MRLTRYIKPPQVRLELHTRNPDEPPEGASRERWVWSVKEQVVGELVELFDASGKIVNASKLRTDLVNRERKATTALGGGIAVPHVRTLQARDFVLCFARSAPGVEFDAPDGRPVHLFVGVVAPPYEDKLYLQVYRELALLFKSDAVRETLMTTTDVHEVIRIVSDYDSWGW